MRNDVDEDGTRTSLADDWLEHRLHNLLFPLQPPHGIHCQHNLMAIHASHGSANWLARHHGRVMTMQINIITTF